MGRMSTQQALSAYLAELSFGKRLETAAAMAVASSVGLTLQTLDPGGGSVQLPDFTMSDAQGNVAGVLEITTTTDADRAQFMARAGNLAWDFAELEWVWVIHVTGKISPREIHSQISPLLQDLEQDGRTGGWIPALPGLREHDDGALPRPLADLGVKRACVFHRQASGPGSVLIGQAGPAGAFSVEAVVKAAECQLRKPDNIAKLFGCGRTGRAVRVAGRWHCANGAVYPCPPGVRGRACRTQVALAARRGNRSLGCSRSG
jgi:hypothetical protein